MSIDNQDILNRLDLARTKKEKKPPPPNKPEKPLHRNAPLKRGGKPKARSEKMRGVIAVLRPLYDAFMKDKEECEIKSPVCTGRAECVHHVEGRGIKVILDQSKWKASCGACNGYVEIKDAEAKEKGHKRSKHTK